MRGKHHNSLIHGLATLSRERLRWQIADSVAWSRLESPEAGCTAIVGVCSRLPDVLAANMRCLYQSRWPELKRVVLAVDCTREAFPASIETTVRQVCRELEVDFLFYSPAQMAMAKRLELPFVYSWLSWCIALAQVRTEHVLIHDYDALVLGPTLRSRYLEFIASGAKVQGISWYKSNGVEENDHLATTFEAFFDVPWLRSHEPVQLFNKMRLIDDRSIDLDTTLDIQRTELEDDERTVIPMDLEQLVHPSQMVHQYTMFNRQPGAPLPCFSIPMIPFFAYLGGNTALLEKVVERIESDRREDIDFLSDGTRFNFSELGTAQVDWALKQMVQAFVALNITPDPRVYRYGSGLYRLSGAKASANWLGDFTPTQREWIAAASEAARAQDRETAPVPRYARPDTPEYAMPALA